MKLTEINLYPVKSCAGFSVTSIDLDRFGPEGDRRWMVVDESSRFISQRERPIMCRIEVVPEEGGIHLSCNGAAISVPQPAADVPGRQVRIWADHVAAQDAGDEAAAWLSNQLGKGCRLVFMPQDSVRLVDGLYARDGESVGFADGFPLLLISQASLDGLNSRLPSPVPMNRFRPNLVISGCAPFAEDGWRRIRIGEIDFDVAKACARCVIPSIIQDSGERDPHINRILAGFRRSEGQVYFGQNLLYQRSGRLSTGDTLKLIA